MSETDSEPKSKEDVYHDRNLLALAFIEAYDHLQTELGANYAVGWWPDTDDVNGSEWAVVWANLPQGQVGWHIPVSMVPEWLPKKDPEYDGYTTAEKNARLVGFVRGDR